MTGRAYVDALGPAGERGVDQLRGWWRDDVRHTMALVGTTTVKQLDRSILDLRGPE
jgi:isopentenyl diphosphate isomerase/L-lactate dehydrogenase-like FMN-dependent dehydrogenase